MDGTDGSNALNYYNYRAAAVPKTMTDQNCIRAQWAPSVSRTQTHTIDDELGHHLNLQVADLKEAPQAKT